MKLKTRQVEYQFKDRSIVIKSQYLNFLKMFCIMPDIMLKGLILNLNVYHCLPYKRLTELLIDVFNLKISEGTIYNTLKTAHTKLEKVENFFKEQFIRIPTVLMLMKLELK